MKWAAAMVIAATGPAAPLPRDQARFCGLIGAGATAYAPAYRDYEAAADPAAKRDIRPRLQDIRIARDQWVFDLLARNRLRVRNWRVTVAASRAEPGGGDKRDVTLETSALCGIQVMLQMRLLMEPDVFDLLHKTPGQALIVSGTFLPHDIEGDFAPAALVWNDSEAGAMNRPVYHLDVTEFRISPQ